MELIKHKEHVYGNEVAKIEIKLRREFFGQDWLRELPLYIGYKAVDLLVGQYRLLLTAQQEVNPWPLKPCTNRFSNQWGAPVCPYTSGAPVGRRGSHEASCSTPLVAKSPFGKS